MAVAGVQLASLKRSQFFSLDLPDTLFKMVAYGTRAERLEAYANVGAAGVDSARLLALTTAALRGDFSLEVAKSAPVWATSRPPDVERLEFAAVFVSDAVLDGIKWLLPLCGRLATSVGGAAREDAAELMLSFARCSAPAVAMYAVEGLAYFVEDAKLEPVMRECASVVLGAPDPAKAAAIEGPMGFLPWAAVGWLAKRGDADAEKAMLDALAAAHASPRDIFDLNRGLLGGLGFKNVSVYPRMLEPFLLLLKKAVLRDETAQLPWVNSETLTQWYAMRALGAFVSVVRSEQVPVAKRPALLNACGAVASSYLERSGYRDHPFGWRSVLQKALMVATQLELPAMRGEVALLLSHDDPSVVREATNALLACAGLQGAVDDIVAAATTFTSAEAVAVLSNALRMLVQKQDGNARQEVIEALEEEMNGGTKERQEAARLLLIEMGGAAAMRKVQARTSSVEAYRAMVREAEDAVQAMFRSTMEEASRGFKIALAMDVTVFAVGMLLIVASAVLAGTQGSLDSWAGVGVTGGTGTLATLYSLFVSKPRQQVRAAVDHQMFIKVVFLGYLRELQQADQSFSRRMMEDRPLSEAEMSAFKMGIQQTMEAGLRHLRSVWSKDASMPDAHSSAQVASNRVSPLAPADVEAGKAPPRSAAALH